MRIGLIVQLHGAPGGSRPAPTWDGVLATARAAEAAGFDSLVFEDALLYRGRDVTFGCLESMSIAAALAASTSQIEIGQSVINAPYRSPALVAKMAKTIDDIAGGRYIFGIGAGNTDDADYEAFGFPTDKRYSRFVEWIEIVHSLIKTGTVDHEGRYWSARKSELVLAGPRPQGPPINIAAGGPKMLRLVARYADAWNWWMASDHGDTGEKLGPILQELEAACTEEGRDPGTLRRTLDLYTVDPSGTAADEGSDAIGDPVAGSPREIADHILGLADLGFEEVRCDVWPKAVPGVEAMHEIVDLVHAG